MKQNRALPSNNQNTENETYLIKQQFYDYYTLMRKAHVKHTCG